MVLGLTAADERAKALFSDGAFRRLIVDGPDPVLVHQDGIINYANRAAARMLDYDSADELLGLTSVGWLHPDDQQRAADHISDLIATQEPPPTIEERFVRKDETVGVAEVRRVALELDNGIAVMAMVRDVSERKKLEAHLLHSERLASVGRVAAGIAHEIRSPLTCLSLSVGTIERAIDRLGSSLSEAARNTLTASLHDAKTEIDRMEFIAQDLTTFSRHDEEAPGVIDVNQTIESALRLAAPDMKYRARLEINLDELPMIRANHIRLGQVFLNLLVNAAHSIPEGQPDLHQISVMSKAEAGRQIVVAITDTGGGIDTEDLHRVFEPFFTTKPMGRGTGLGLSVAHTIVASLGGEIQVESVRNHGTTFRVVLPMR